MGIHGRKYGLWLFLTFALVAVLLLSGCSFVQSNSEPGNVWQEDSAQRDTDTSSQNIVQVKPETSSTQQGSLKEEDPPVEVKELPPESPQGSSQESDQEPLQQDPQKSEPTKETEEQLTQSTKRAIPILYYHSVAYEEGNELRVPPEEFEAHMQYLSQNGYVSIALDDLYRYFYEGGMLPEKPFVLTFDDGYEDNYTNAFPIAEKYGYQGTVFMVTDWIDGPGYLKGKQLLEMSQAGWQIESHTMTHPYLNSISPEQMREELLRSKEVLEGLLGKTVRAFAYPYGVYDSSIVELCKEAGYKMGFTTNRGWALAEDPFQIQRVYCYAQMGLDEFRRRVENPAY